MSAIPPRFTRAGPSLIDGFTAKVVAAFGLAGLIATLTAIRVSHPNPVLPLGAGVALALVLWMFLSTRPEGPFAVLLLYLGLLDGYLKLKTNSSAVTLVRDAFLYAIVAGLLVRALVQREPLRMPPLGGWVVLFTLIVVMQLANPYDTGRLHTLGALRPHLEFVPLFFIGYLALQTPHRLRAFLVIMLVVSVANGVVGLVQLNLTPAQLAAWGPGFAFRLNGQGTGLNKVAERLFETGHGVRTRPFGLGDDSGIGAAWGMLAACGALALVASGRWRIRRWLALLLVLGPPLAIITGQGRGYLIASIAALVAFLALGFGRRRLGRMLAAALVVAIAVGAVTAYVATSSGYGVFQRYLTVGPSQVGSTLNQARGGSFAAIPRLLVRYPLGHGLGNAGPASNFDATAISGSNGETEPGFLLSELGIPGLVIYYGLSLHLLVLAITRLRRLEPETRLLVATFVAGLIAILTLGISSSTSATSPVSPYFWLTGGVLSYWLARVAPIRNQPSQTPELRRLVAA